MVGDHVGWLAFDGDEHAVVLVGNIESSRRKASRPARLVVALCDGDGVQVGTEPFRECAGGRQGLQRKFGTVKGYQDVPDLDIWHDRSHGPSVAERTDRRAEGGAGRGWRSGA